MKISKNKIKLLTFPIIMGILLIFSAGASTATTPSHIYVSTHGNDSWNGQSSYWNGTSGPKATIKSALSTASSGGIIYIANGTYNQNNITINKNMTIIGQSSKSTIINGMDKNTIFTISGATVLLDDLELTNGNSTSNGGAILNNGKLTLDNCNFVHNVATDNGGAVYSVNNTYYSNAENCIFTGNTAGNGGGAVSNGNILTYCSFINNTASKGGAISDDNYDNLTATSNIFLNNSAYLGGAITNDEGTMNLSYNMFYGNKEIIEMGSDNIFSEMYTVNADDNWWGSNSNPSNTIGGFNIDNWIVLTLNQSNPTIVGGQNDNLTAYLTYTNGILTDPSHPDLYYLNPAKGHILNGVTLNWTTKLGNITPQSSFVDGISQAVLNTDNLLTNGESTITAVLENQSLSTTATVTSVPLKVTAIYPSNNLHTNNTSTVINITFNENILKGSTFNDITVKGPPGNIPINKSITGRILTISSTQKYANGSYTIQIPETAVTDLAGDGLLAGYNSSFTIDTIAPTAKSNLNAGFYNTTQYVKLSMSENGTIYYTTNGTNPTTSSTKYLSAITITKTTVLKYMAVDLAGNKSPVYTQTYTIDKVAPKITSTTPTNLKTGVSKTTPITIKFSENILAGVNYSKIYVKNLNTGKIVAITKTLSGNTLTIKQILNRTANYTYEVYIPSSAVRDYAGNKLTATYTFEFKTI